MEQPNRFPGEQPRATNVGPRVCVIILTFNQREVTLNLLRSLHSIWDEPTEVLLWDNGSDDNTCEAVSRQFPKVRIHHHETNLGVASGRNAAAAMALELLEPTHLLFLDNDMELKKGFIESLLEVLLGNPRVGQVQAKLLFMHDKRLINDGGGCRISFLTGKTVPVGYREVDRGQYDTVKPCISCGGAMMVRADVFQQLGGFDPTFDPFGPEDLDFSLRLQKAGFSALYAPKAVAFHAVSHTFGTGYVEEYARHKARHWVNFLKRHGTWPQRLGFYLCFSPYLFLKILLRETRRGNLAAIRGTFRGVLDSFHRKEKAIGSDEKGEQ